MESAVVFDRFGDIAHLSLRPLEVRPVAGSEVRIRVTVAGLNPVDWQIVESRELAAAFGVDVPAGFGNDFAGVVAEIGPEVTRWRVGDRVFGGARGRAVATSITLDESHRYLHRIPPNVADLEAGTLQIAGRTASAVADALAAHPGETVLVGGAGGGVGSILTQLLVDAGVRVIGSGSASSADALRSLGALPVTYGPDLAAGLAATGFTIAAAADLHGTATAETALSLGVPAPRIVTIEADDPPAGVVRIGGADSRPEALRELLAMIAERRLRIPIAAIYRLEQFREAVAHQRSRHVHGKIAIAPTR